MFCFRYDPTTGKYALIAFRVVQIGGLLSMLAVGTLIAVMLTRERVRRGRDPGERQTQPPQDPHPVA
jgi:protein SCO1/2